MADKHLSIKERGLNFEMLIWFLTRVTALAMYALLFTGAVGALVMGARTQMNLADVIRWSFMPNVYHVQSTNLQDTAPWSTLFWQITGSAFLLIAVAHGVHGLITIADDYIISARGRGITRLTGILLVVAMCATGLYLLWTV
jgi:succinate dehydrogenase hydrophobic anchor subunit